ncbi:phenylacetate-CoA oxygenase/reductase subunit PaaK [Zobellella endophytica]|uniref:Phenylacetate-CoA oxygenase/reductase subunit PaaK n=1 Tax=Zobellella endophytica TaxID=2116700 RepID=A0A2P7R646_9GAMM|nr:1,2-phenylacetyl-CoA epoxidase subunit PaaE [Zobellella endophytica]PSJ45673.1 phenylacetate-CoA oxygenase/reductase subunit PaaK [Zobellella endophytica]
MNQFYSLRVKSVQEQTQDAIAIAFELEGDNKERFRFRPGQHLTLRYQDQGEELRRCYSICSRQDEEELTIAVKRVPGGRFSNWVNDNLKAGDALEVMPPQGLFFQHAEKQGGESYLGFAAGSGITPLLSIVKAVLGERPDSRFTLVYGNRSWRQTMFAEALADLKDRYPSRFQLICVFSREQGESDILNGRLDAARIQSLFASQLLADRYDHCFACGPEEMMQAVEQVLPDHGLARERIHTERFNSGVPRAISAEQRAARSQGDVSLLLDGREFRLEVSAEDDSILDAALRAGADLPYACKGGVCATCKCRVLEGEVDMALNYSLEQDEVARGYVLSCQARPRSGAVRISFDD